MNDSNLSFGKWRISLPFDSVGSLFISIVENGGHDCLLSFDFQVSRIENESRIIFIKHWGDMNSRFFIYFDRWEWRMWIFRFPNIENRKILSMIEEGLESMFLCLLTVEDGRCESTSFDFQALETEDMNLLASLKQWKSESMFFFLFLFTNREWKM